MVQNKLSPREAGTIVAALRHWQNQLTNQRLVLFPDELLAEIATGDNRFDPLSVQEIDALCEQLRKDSSA